MKQLKLAKTVLAVSICIAAPVSTLVAADATEKLVPTQPEADKILDDAQGASTDLIKLLDHGKAFHDEAKRAGAAPKALPLLQCMLAPFETPARHLVRTARGMEYKFQPLAMLAYFGDEKTIARLREDSQSKDETTAVEAKIALTMCDWWKSAHDEAGQTRVLESLRSLVHDHPTDNQVAIAVDMMYNTSPDSQTARNGVVKVANEELKSPMGKMLAERLAAAQKLKDLEGKPLDISGLLLSGKNFNVADWKGKVVVVDFWATWCKPCLAELPRVKKAYADYHAKGLEIIGVSCDRGPGPLAAFLQQNPDMPWPQLIDPAHPGWHPLANKLGINGIPTMFLIDKAGIVRTVSARDNFEELIPAMLEENGGKN